MLAFGLRERPALVDGVMLVAAGEGRRERRHAVDYRRLEPAGRTRPGRFRESGPTLDA
jgi:hypothetical protein